jgi:two-component sensor histidine kinase
MYGGHLCRPNTFSCSSAWDQVVILLICYCSGSLVLAAAESYRRLARLFYENEHHNKIVIDELNHRVKNKLATVQAILSHELRNNKDVWDTISARLAAISKTDDLILQLNGRGTELAEILGVEFLPYCGAASSRIVCMGTPLILPPKLAISLALILHELVTNAAKYGSLSVPDGRIRVSWKADRDRVETSWVESGGPTTTTLHSHNYGISDEIGEMGPS